MKCSECNYLEFILFKQIIVSQVTFITVTDLIKIFFSTNTYSLQNEKE